MRTFGIAKCMSKKQFLRYNFPRKLQQKACMEIISKYFIVFPSHSYLYSYSSRQLNLSNNNYYNGYPHGHLLSIKAKCSLSYCSHALIVNQSRTSETKLCNRWTNEIKSLQDKWMEFIGRKKKRMGWRNIEKRWPSRCMQAVQDVLNLNPRLINF